MERPFTNAFIMPLKDCISIFSWELIISSLLFLYILPNTETNLEIKEKIRIKVNNTKNLAHPASGEKIIHSKALTIFSNTFIWAKITATAKLIILESPEERLKKSFKIPESIKKVKTHKIIIKSKVKDNE